ncbi:MAG TPA: DUF2141 domain-containing protein [Croceibacterium sp.]
MPARVALVRTAIVAVCLFTLSAAAEPAFVEVSVAGQRSDRGMLRACLTRDPAHFPECEGDPAAVSASFAASERAFRIGPVPQGTWALAVFHDENGNGRLDTLLGVPREGFAFSRNPPLRLGPPEFDQASVTIADHDVEAPVRLRYLL